MIAPLRMEKQARASHFWKLTSVDRFRRVFRAFSHYFCTPILLRPPELYFMPNSPVSFMADIWTLACTIFSNPGLDLSPKHFPPMTPIGWFKCTLILEGGGGEGEQTKTTRRTLFRSRGENTGRRSVKTRRLL